MNTLRVLIPLLGSFLGLLLSSSVLAHTPVCRCDLNGQQIECEGRFHDGSDAAGTTMKVLSYVGEMLASGTLDKRSRFTATLPTQPFYILMDVGAGEMFEVDWRDITGLTDKQFKHTDSGQVSAHY